MVYYRFETTEELTLPPPPSIEHLVNRHDIYLGEMSCDQCVLTKIYSTERYKVEIHYMHASCGINGLVYIK